MHSVQRTESKHSVGPSSEFDDTSDSLVESRLQYASLQIERAQRIQPYAISYCIFLKWI